MTRKSNRKSRESTRQLRLPFLEETPTPGKGGRASAPRKTPTPRVAEMLEPASSEAQDIERYFRRVLSRPVSMTYTRNRRQLISFKDERGGTRRVRISDVFAKAGPDVWREIAYWMLDTRSHKLFSPGSPSKRYLDRAEVIRTLQARRPRHTELPVKGVHVDLKKIFDDMNARYFDGKCNSHIGWKRVAARKGTRSVQLGTFHADDNTILIHPVLDTNQIPRYVVEDTVYHEMVHWKLRGRHDAAGRREIHSPEFHEEMRRYPKHIEAEVWVAENIRMLIRAKNRMIEERRKARRAREQSR